MREGQQELAFDSPRLGWSEVTTPSRLSEPTEPNHLQVGGLQMILINSDPVLTYCGSVLIYCDPDQRPLRRQTSTAASRALSWMNSRRGSTTSPISLANRSLASSSCSTETCSRVRALTSSVVSHSCSGFISPRPL